MAVLCLDVKAVQLCALSNSFLFVPKLACATTTSQPVQRRGPPRCVSAEEMKS